MTTSATPVPTKTRRQQRRRSRRLSPPLSPLRGTIDRSGKRRSPAPDEAKEWEDRIREDFANHLKAKGIGSWKLFLFTVMRFLTEANVWPWSADRKDYEDVYKRQLLGVPLPSFRVEGNHLIESEL